LGQEKSGAEELLDATGLKWIDIFEPDSELMNRLGARFGLHALEIEDTLQLDQRPKIEEYPSHQFIVLQSFSCPGEIEQMQLHEMHLFLGPDWVISVHDKAEAVIAAVHKRIESDLAGTIGRGVDFVAYLISDALMDQNFPMLDHFNDELEDLETAIFDAPRRELLQRAFALKRNLVQVRRVLSPQRDVVGLLARRGVPHVQERTALYFRDVYDHLVRLYEQIDAARDLLGNAMEGYLSVMANKTNEITKQLTLFASIFMPLSFVVGFFGQNFTSLTRPEYFWASLGVIVLLPVGMVGYFWKRGWL
jgi:magnesium transporter